MPIFENNQHWILETENTAYVFGMGATGFLTHCYWGAKLPQHNDYPTPSINEGWSSFNAPANLIREEYPAHAGPKFIDPCLKTTFADGTRDTVLVFESATHHDNELQIHLRDAHFPVQFTLHYRILAAHDLIERFVTVRNAGSDDVTLERIWSAQWHLPEHHDYRLSHLAGAWFKETQLLREPLGLGLKTLESRRLTTSHQHNPWFALDNTAQPASENTGEVWFGVLAWSGNWKLSAERTVFGSSRVSLGINDWDFAWRLGPGETFTTPSSIAGFTAQGFTGASHALHGYMRGLLPHQNQPRRVLYNSWEATFFDVDEHSQTELAKIAAGLGVELFVLDDGWFHGRKSDNAGLGDWWPDAKKFPNGLQPLIASVNALGMDFGLWLEPEMCNPDSELYRAHPDWVIHFPVRQRSEMRNQLILNLARQDVQDHLIARLDDLLSKNNIAFIKWDMNRNVSEPGWPDAPEPRAIWVAYVRGLYRVWETLRQRHPNVIWQSCSGGGGRADAGMLRLADQIWISDNTEPTMRLRIQEGFSQVFPANTMEAWVTASGPKHLPLEFRFHVSMTGVLGVGAHLLHWNDEEKEIARRCIALYKNIRQVVQFGDQYRLQGAHDGSFSSVFYVAQDKSEAVLFAFRTHIPDPAWLPKIRLRGLDVNALYELEGEGTRSGAAWMNVGVEISLSDFHSTVRRLRRVS